MHDLSITATHSQRILEHIANVTGLLKGIDISNAVGLSYKATIDALNTLLNQGRVARIGAKSATRWTGVVVDCAPMRLEDYWHGRRAPHPPGGSPRSGTRP